MAGNSNKCGGSLMTFTQNIYIIESTNEVETHKRSAPMASVIVKNTIELDDVYGGAHTTKKENWVFCKHVSHFLPLSITSVTLFVRVVGVFKIATATAHLMSSILFQVFIGKVLIQGGAFLVANV